MHSSIIFQFYVLAILATLSHFTHAAPIPGGTQNINANNAGTGSGGIANGGSVTGAPHDSLLGGLIGGGSLVNVASDNAGGAGRAGSGSAITRPYAFRRYGTEQHYEEPTTINETKGNANTGAGGQATGGSVNNAAGLINIFSNNAGKGGDATSGEALVIKKRAWRVRH